MLAIYKRELRSYFLTSVAYVYLATLFVFFGINFLFSNVLARVSYMGQPSPISGNFAPVLGQMLLIMLFITPILTMKLLSEERRQKTDQLLHTVPVSTFEIVMAKFFSAMTVFTLAVIVSMIYPALLHFLADAAVRQLIAAYLGFYLVGASFIAICTFASAVTESMFIAALLGFGITLLMWFLEFFAYFIPVDIVKNALEFLALVSRHSDFVSGIIKLDSVVYYLSVVIVFLFLTMRAIDKRRWTEG